MSSFNPSFDGFSLSDDSNYIVSEVEDRTIPVRDIVMASISRKPGSKLVSHEFLERQIKMAGFVLGDSASDLQDNIDALHTNMTRQESGTLIVRTGRQITATVKSFNISDPHYSQTLVPFDIEFVAPQPFWLGTQQTASTTVASGTASQSITLTVSGTTFAEPTITFTSDSGDVAGGNTTTSGIQIEYSATGEQTTWSGGGTATLAYGDFVSFDYENQLINEGSTSKDPDGVFMRWEPGSTTFTVTFSGMTQGGTLDFVYRPRYL